MIRRQICFAFLLLTRVPNDIPLTIRNKFSKPGTLFYNQLNLTDGKIYSYSLSLLYLHGRVAL